MYYELNCEKGSEEGFSEYMRFCKYCHEKYYTPCKFSHVCDKCKNREVLEMAVSYKETQKHKQLNEYLLKGKY